ncbi:hypothetical protein CsSME_00041003 [Camellia sinensis var. sinensis]
MSMEALIQRFTGSFLDRNHHTYPDLPFNLVDGDAIHASPSPPTSVVSSEGDAGEEGDFSDATLKLISQMLMEDGLENKPCMYQDCLALQATEKSFYDVLGKQYPPHLSSDDNSPRTCSSDSSNSSVSVNDFIDQSSWIREKFKPSYYDEYTFESIMQSISSPNGSGDGSVDSLPFQISSEAKFGELVPTTDYVNYRSESTWKVLEGAEQNQGDHPPHGSREKKTHNREDADYTDGAGRSNKQLASFAEEADDQLYDKVLLCPRLNPHLHQDEPLHFLCTEHDDDDASSIVAGRKSPQNGVAAKGANGGGRGRGKKQGNKKEVIDLRTLLSQCAQAVANADIRNANELLNRIRQHASPTGDGTERLAYYFANALEARLAGTGTSLYAAFKTKRISVADILKGYQVFMKACPFNKMSNMFANKSIAALVHAKQTLHIIDFGVLYGFQWPCLIQHFSVREGGPPKKLRFTGIDFPQPGFRPKERVEETGRRLAIYCKRFNVPFEYTAIAKKWSTIELEELNIDRDEVLVVNCLYRLRNVPDETVVESSPRDAVLNLVKRINPDMFIHGVINGTYNAPFFVTRFREALFHFSAGFDVFETTLPREDQGRMLYEKEILGRDIMNVIACEGTERVERPETYKQWQVRNTRAGFRQLQLNKELVTEVKTKVKLYYNENFVVDEDGKWLLQGWKGRIMFALSCWKPVKER